MSPPRTARGRPPQAATPSRGSGIGRSKVDVSVRPGPVVVLDEDAEDPLQVTSAEDQDVVEALSSNGADPTLRARVCPACPHGCLDDAEALGPEDLVERSENLASRSLRRSLF